MLYIVRSNGQLDTRPPKLDSSNNCRHVLTMPTNDANTKMIYAENKVGNLYFSPNSPADSTAGRWTHIVQNADDYHRTLTPSANSYWGVAGNYTFPSHPGWLVARDGCLCIDGTYSIRQFSIDDLNTWYESAANPGLYGGNYWLFNAGSAFAAGQSNHIAAWGMNGGGTLLNTPIYEVGYGMSFIGPAGTPTAPSFTSSGMEGLNYPVSVNTAYNMRNGSTSQVGYWQATNPESCNWAMETIWIPLSSSVGGEQTWGTYTWYDMTTPGYRFWANGGDQFSGYYASGIFASSGYITYTTSGSGFRNAMAWRLLWQPSWTDTRACRSYAQENVTVTRTNTDGSQFVASDHYNGEYSGDLGGSPKLTTVIQMA